jgi:hypothetical protein
MYSMNAPVQRKWILFVCFLLTGALILTACGTNSTTTGSNPATGTTSTLSPTPTIQTTKGYGAPYGCPSDAVVSAAPAVANITVRPGQGHTTFAVQPGNVVEVQMPFGIAWRGPEISGEGLQLQSPSGYVWKASNACIWRYTAQNTGTVKLTFVGSVICKQNLHCALAEVIDEFTIKVG